MEGFVRAIERGRDIRFHAPEDMCGVRDVAPLVGVDPYGNRYYEDFHANEHNESSNGMR